MTDISIIIPTYNRLWSLPETLASCRQSSAHVEIIVIDDGSTDGTWEWLQTQPSVRAVRQQNLGKDWAVNHGFKLATGEYVRFLDSDDLLVPGANDLQLEAARRTGADVVVAGYVFWDSSNDDRRTVAWTHCDDFIAQQLGECDSSHYSAYLFRRKFIAQVPHRQEYGARDDRMFVIEMAMLKPAICDVDEPCLIHRSHPNDRLQFQRGLAETVTHWHTLRVFQRAARMLETAGEFDLRRRRAMIRILWPLAHWIAYTHLDDACRLVAWIRQLDPDFRPPDAGLLGTLYRRLGFHWTERVLSLRRGLIAIPRRFAQRRALSRMPCA
jgi:glycosyltransferase involved in cell wall biosynthesis